MTTDEATKACRKFLNSRLPGELRLRLWKCSQISQAKLTQQRAVLTQQFPEAKVAAMLRRYVFDHVLTGLRQYDADQVLVAIAPELNSRAKVEADILAKQNGELPADLLQEVEDGPLFELFAELQLS